MNVNWIKCTGGFVPSGAVPTNGKHPTNNDFHYPPPAMSPAYSRADLQRS